MSTLPQPTFASDATVIARVSARGVEAGLGDQAIGALMKVLRA